MCAQSTPTTQRGAASASAGNGVVATSASTTSAGTVGSGSKGDSPRESAVATPTNASLSMSSSLTGSESPTPLSDRGKVCQSTNVVLAGLCLAVEHWIRMRGTVIKHGNMNEVNLQIVFSIAGADEIQNNHLGVCIRPPPPPPRLRD